MTTLHRPICQRSLNRSDQACIVGTSLWFHAHLKVSPLLSLAPTHLSPFPAATSGLSSLTLWLWLQGAVHPTSINDASSTEETVFSKLKHFPLSSFAAPFPLRSEHSWGRHRAFPPLLLLKKKHLEGKHLQVASVEPKYTSLLLSGLALADVFEKEPKEGFVWKVKKRKEPRPI